MWTLSVQRRVIFKAPSVIAAYKQQVLTQILRIAMIVKDLEQKDRGKEQKREEEQKLMDAWVQAIEYHQPTTIKLYKDPASYWAHVAMTGQPPKDITFLQWGYKRLNNTTNYLRPIIFWIMSHYILQNSTNKSMQEVDIWLTEELSLSQTVVQRLRNRAFKYRRLFEVLGAGVAFCGKVPPKASVTPSRCRYILINDAERYYRARGLKRF